jgi:hypothetical protein
MTTFKIISNEISSAFENKNVNLIKGIQGKQGEQGEQGDKGDQGDEGEQGEPGSPGYISNNNTYGTVYYKYYNEYGDFDSTTCAQLNTFSVQTINNIDILYDTEEKFNSGFRIKDPGFYKISFSCYFKVSFAYTIGTGLVAENIYSMVIKNEECPNTENLRILCGQNLCVNRFFPPVSLESIGFEETVSNSGSYIDKLVEGDTIQLYVAVNTKNNPNFTSSITIYTANLTIFKIADI